MALLGAAHGRPHRRTHTVALGECDGVAPSPLLRRSASRLCWKPPLAWCSGDAPGVRAPGGEPVRAAMQSAEEAATTSKRQPCSPSRSRLQPCTQTAGRRAPQAGRAEALAVLGAWTLGSCCTPTGAPHSTGAFGAVSGLTGAVCNVAPCIEVI